MKKKTLLFGGLLIAGGATVAVRSKIAAERKTMFDAQRWHVITVNRPASEIAGTADLPAPLLSLGEMIEIEIRPAPGDKGTEIAARLIAIEADEDPKTALRKLRKALRDTQWLIETGEVLSPDKPPSTRTTLTSLPIEIATRRAKGEGRL
ncbi:MAG: hypothetical protein JWL85_229 [Candidatus Saccharibacteria bacterium]|nr:hypothetical protein [Candidatus Saccharibacteria bacterium]